MQDGHVKRVVQDFGCIDIEIEMLAYRNLDGVAVSLIIFNSQGVGVLHTVSNIKRIARPICKGSQTLRFTLPPLLLGAGKYSLTVEAAIPNVHEYFLQHDVTSVRIETSNAEVHRYAESTWQGVLSPQIGEWSYL